MSVVAVVPAAGRGRRMGGVDKPLLLLRGRPLLLHLLDRLEASRVERIYVAVVPDRMEHLRRVVGSRQGVVDLVAGGVHRQDSVGRALEAIKGRPEVVVIHDAARPLVEPELIDRVAEAAQRYGAATAAIPLVDTVKEVQEGWVRRTLDRSLLWAAQTPQAFRYELILEAHREARRRGMLATDDAALVEMLGRGVRVVVGSSRNLKLTVPEDLKVAEGLL